MLSRKSKRQEVREYVDQRLGLGDYDDLVDVLRGATTTFDWAPSRSTFYGWVKEYRDARARDGSDAWTLAKDDTGRPDVVMRVLGMLVNRSDTARARVTQTEAGWIVRLATALPDILREDGDFTWPDLADSSDTQVARERAAERIVAGRRGTPPLVGLWYWARQYVDRESAGGSLAELDATMAFLYADSRAHLYAVARPPQPAEEA